METCHALAGRGHDVHLVVRPDTHTPARDPFAYYGLPRTDRLIVERAPVGGPQLARRIGYLAFAATRAVGAGRADIVMTRDLAVASLLLRLPCASTARLRIARLRAGGRGGAAAISCRRRRRRAAAKLARLARRESFVWRHADGYVTITNGLASTQNARFGARARVAVVPDGARLTIGRTARHAWPPGALHRRVRRPPLRVEGRRRAARRDLARAGRARAHHRRPREEPDLARLRALAARLGVESRVTFTGHLAPSDVAGRLARGRHPGAAEPGVGDLDARDVAAQAVRIHGGGQGDRGLEPAGDPRDPDPRRQRRARHAR